MAKPETPEVKETIYFDYKDTLGSGRQLYEGAEELLRAQHSLGRRLVIVSGSSDEELEAVFSELLREKILSGVFGSSSFRSGDKSLMGIKDGYPGKAIMIGNEMDIGAVRGTPEIPLLVVYREQWITWDKINTVINRVLGDDFEKFMAESTTELEELDPNWFILPARANGASIVRLTPGF